MKVRLRIHHFIVTSMLRDYTARELANVLNRKNGLKYGRLVTFQSNWQFSPGERALRTPPRSYLSKFHGSLVYEGSFRGSKSRYRVVDCSARAYMTIVDWGTRKIHATFTSAFVCGAI